MQLEHIATILEKIAAVEDAREYTAQQLISTQQHARAEAITTKLSSVLGDTIDTSKLAMADDDLLELLSKVADAANNNDTALGAASNKQAQCDLDADDAFIQYCLS